MATVQACCTAWISGGDIKQEKTGLGVESTYSYVRAAFGEEASVLMPKKVLGLSGGLESSLGAEGVEAVTGVVIGNHTVADTVEEVVAKGIEEVTGIGATVTKEWAVWNGEEEMVGKEPVRLGLVHGLMVDVPEGFAVSVELRQNYDNVFIIL